MPHRIEVELTSQRDDTTWTWRAAGAKQPKGELDGSLLPADAKVGDVLRAEADFALDGIDIISVLPPKERQRSEPERIEILGSRNDQAGVTTQLVEKRGGRGRKGDRREGGGNRKGPRRDRPRGEHRERPERPAPPARPKPKRLKAGRAHRSAVLRAVADDQRPMAEVVLKGGLPGARAAIERMNEAAAEHGQPPVAAAPLLGLAEQLLPHLRMAEWHDRADAALADVDELDLRDLRQVVVAADANARDEATRELAASLREALGRRVDEEHAAWLRELTELLDEGRVVRALRLSSRPPKAGAMFPPELATRLADGASASLTTDVSDDRYATVLDALAYSPVRTQVVPTGVPERPSDSLVSALRKLADRIPQVATAFGVEPAPPGRGPRGGRNRKPRRKGGEGARGGSGAGAGAGASEQTRKATTGEQPATEAATSEPTPSAPPATEATSEPAPESSSSPAAPADDPRP